MIILSLDISSTNIGIAFIQSHKKQLIHGCILKPNKKLELFQQFNEIQTQLKILLDSYNPEIIVIEKYIPFMKGKSKASTIILLSQWNTMIAFFLFNKGIPIVFQHVSTTRARLKSPGEERIFKEDVPNILLNKYGIKIDVKDSGNDLSDAVAQGIAYCIKEGL